MPSHQGLRWLDFLPCRTSLPGVAEQFPDPAEVGNTSKESVSVEQDNRFEQRSWINVH